MESAQRLAQLLMESGVPFFGICRFDDVLPLLPVRSASRIPTGAQSVVVCGFPYYVGEFSYRNLSRYAMLEDYHQVISEVFNIVLLKVLKSNSVEQWASFVDNGPIREVAAGYLAGLGMLGKNGLLIHPNYGARFFLGELVTTSVFDRYQTPMGDCPACGRCTAACPTQAIGAGGMVERSKCRSHITQKKGELTAYEQEQVRLGGKAWGCDLCSDACPFNSREFSPLDGFYQDITPVVRMESLPRLMEHKAFGYRGIQVMKRNLQLLDL